MSARSTHRGYSRSILSNTRDTRSPLHSRSSDSISITHTHRRRSLEVSRSVPILRAGRDHGANARPPRHAATRQPEWRHMRVGASTRRLPPKGVERGAHAKCGGAGWTRLDAPQPGTALLARHASRPVAARIALRDASDIDRRAVRELCLPLVASVARDQALQHKRIHGTQ